MQLTTDILSVTEGGKTQTLRLADITRVTLGEARRRAGRSGSLPYWTANIETGQGESISLALDLTVGPFDPRPILRDLLPRLPAGAQVDPRIQTYLVIGQVQ